MERGLIVIWLCICMATLGGFIFPNQSFQHLKKGDIAPDFTTASIDGKEITLSSFTQKGNVVILFYQGFWCTGCNKQLNTFKADLAKITKKGGHTIAISPTTLTGTPQRFHTSTINLLIIIDKDVSLMSGFGILNDEPSEYFRANKSYVALDFSFILATYIIDENMKVKFAHVDPSFTINAFVDSLLVHP